jgi:hypothetical protein
MCSPRKPIMLVVQKELQTIMTISLSIFNRHYLLPIIKIVAEFAFHLCLEETHMHEEPV